MTAILPLKEKGKSQDQSGNWKLSYEGNFMDREKHFF